MNLEGNVAVVTGASSGIGRATAHALAKEGAQLLLAGRSQALLNETVSAIRDAGNDVMSMTIDVRRETDVVTLVETAVSQLGGIDILVNSAGVGYPGPAVEGRVEEWREMLETNVLGLCVACREAARAMAGRGGTLVNISALAGSTPSPGFAAYAASKHAVNGFSDTLRLELAGSGIRVLVIEPGPTMTSFLRNVPHPRLQELGRDLGLPPDSVPNFEGQHAPPEFIEGASRGLAAHFFSADEVAAAVVSALVDPDPSLEKITLRLEDRR